MQNVEIEKVKRFFRVLFFILEYNILVVMVKHGGAMFYTGFAPIKNTARVIGRNLNFNSRITVQANDAIREKH